MSQSGEQNVHYMAPLLPRDCTISFNSNQIDHAVDNAVNRNIKKRLGDIQNQLCAIIWLTPIFFIIITCLCIVTILMLKIIF